MCVCVINHHLRALEAARKRGPVGSRRQLRPIPRVSAQRPGRSDRQLGEKHLHKEKKRAFLNTQSKGTMNGRFMINVLVYIKSPVKSLYSEVPWCRIG